MVVDTWYWSILEGIGIASIEEEWEEEWGWDNSSLGQSMNGQVDFSLKSFSMPSHFLPFFFRGYVPSLLFPWWKVNISVFPRNILWFLSSLSLDQMIFAIQKCFSRSFVIVFSLVSFNVRDDHSRSFLVYWKSKSWEKRTSLFAPLSLSLACHSFLLSNGSREFFSSLLSSSLFPITLPLPPSSPSDLSRDTPALVSPDYAPIFNSRKSAEIDK